MLQRCCPFLLEDLDAVGQREGEQNGFCGHRQRKEVGVPGRGLNHTCGAQQEQVDATQDHAEAEQIKQCREIALAPAAERSPQRGGNRGERQRHEYPGAERAPAEGVEQHGGDIQRQGKGQQAMRPGHELACLQQRLGESAGAEPPECRDADAVEPEGHRAVRPEVLKAMAGHR